MGCLLPAESTYHVLEITYQASYQMGVRVYQGLPGFLDLKLMQSIELQELPWARASAGAAVVICW